jgi:hypothetical protein
VRGGVKARQMAYCLLRMITALVSKSGASLLSENGKLQMLNSRLSQSDVRAGDDPRAPSLTGVFVFASAT